MRQFFNLNMQGADSRGSPLLPRGANQNDVQKMPNSFFAGGGVVMESNR